MAGAPIVSVGMPAYNSEKTLRQSIDCLLGQALSDLELVVSDNASTDGTWDILQDYARRDPRVRPIRQSVNIGANGNYSAVFLASRGRYFKWASSNDWCAPRLLQACVDRLEADPGTVLVAPRTRLFESDVDDAVDYRDDIACRDESPVQRFIHVGTHLALNNVMNGVVRRDALAKTRLIEHYPGADVVLVAHLALLGKIELLDEALFYRRMDAATATRLMSSADVHRHHYPVPTWRASLPSWRLAAGWLRVALLTGGLSLRDRTAAVDWVLRRAYWSRADIGRDLVELLRLGRRS
ncbi:MAG: glycosyltransferase family 2 protein [Piscinibacter sp.]|uniref:glycosyltransferase family 2 protein n=1 Tax=Piscinibacter sp. TaxID=1903157 RepID=UPI003D0A9A7A